MTNRRSLKSQNFRLTEAIRVFAWNFVVTDFDFVFLLVLGVETLEILQVFRAIWGFSSRLGVVISFEGGLAGFVSGIRTVTEKSE